PVQAPEVSIVVVVHNGVRFTAMCLESLLADADAPAAEVVVVDNGSTDETPQLLDALHRLDGRVRVVSLNRNMGFAKGNNAGIAAARGETVVLLNNDTIVTPGWLRPLLAHLTDGAVGLVGPTTSRTCNEAEIESPYRTVGELAEFAAARWRAFAGRGFDIGMLAMFCVAGRRSTFEQIGALDESFELGLFEDDDYAMRARAAGFRLMCAEDAFVHHFGQASLGTVLDSERYDDLFNRNRARFEAKWSTKWTPHARRMSEAYVDLRDRTCRAVEELTPAGANVLVTAKGDDALLAFEGRTGGHFPGLPDGSFLGEYPADSAVAIDVLEAQRQAGAQYLVFPSSSAWWLDHYAGLRLHLHSAYGQPVASTDDLTMWSLDHAAAAAAGALGTGGGSGGAGGDGDGTDVAALRRLVAEQADALARMQAEVSALRDAVLRPNPDFSTAGGAVEKMEGGVGEDVRETWRILDRALDETGASKHTRYLLLRARLRAAVSAITPAGATIAFVSRGDDDLLDIPGRTGWHVPRMPDGAWSAGLPERGADAVRHVELVRAFGADFLVLPAPYGWWLDHYRELADHLSTHAVAKLADPELGWAWDLRAEGMADGGDVSIDAVVAGARRRLGGTDPTVLDWDSGFELAERLPDMAVFSPPVSGDELPYLDGTADLVFVGPRADGQLDEATRVAAVGVVQLQAGGGISRCTVAWKTAPGSAESTVSVVVPEGGSSDAIVRSLPAGLSGEILVPGYALAGQAGQGQRDEGQPDRSDGPDVVVRRIPPEGQPGAWAQAAAQAASGDVVVFIDPRLIPLRGWLEGLVQELGPRTDVAAATGTVMLGDALGLGVAQTAEGTNGLLAVRRSALEQAGGLPQAGSLGEACALLLERLHELGHRVTTDANAVAARIESMEKE
ncbi:MAG: hypothetical protein QOI20_2422, partial [Acidimicrobiaceae bacterium]|nr:hypothetical protein [Acidimicrobiaceae bacterium]